MPEPGAIPPLLDAELVYRRLPANPQYVDAPRRQVKDLAFRPTPADVDGLSLARQRVGAEGAAALGREGKQFYVAVLRVADIVRRLDLTLVADRDDHAIIVELTYAARESTVQSVRNQVISASANLAAAVVDAVGPFPGQAVPPTAPPPSPGG